MPKWAAFTNATVKAYIDRVEAVSGEGTIATRARSRGRGRGEWVVDALLCVAALSARPHALDHSRVFRDWALPPAFGGLRELLERQHGPDAGIRQYVRVLQLLSEHPAGCLAEANRRLWHRQHLRYEYVEEKAHQIATGRTMPIPIAPVRKNDSSSAR